VAHFRIVGLAIIICMLAACGTSTTPTENTTTAGPRATTAPAATAAEEATQLSPQEALTASAAEASVVASTPGVVQLSPEEALTAAAAEATVASTPGVVQLSPEEALTAAAAEATVASTPGVVQLSPEEALTAAAAEATVASTPGVVQLSPAEALTAAAAEATVASTPGVVQLSPDEALTAAAAEPTAAARSTAVPPAQLEPVTLGLGYIPNVQFAPFYVAAAKGYYAAEGLKVDFSYGGNVNDLLLQTATGQLPFVMAAGDEVLLARSRGVPIKMVSLVFQQMPVAVFSKAGAGIAQPADLRGKTIGLPGRYGATYIALRGLLYSQNLQENDVTLTEIGFTQFEAVQADRVPAAVGYANNEPLRLADSGAAVNVIKVSDYIDLVSNGIVTSESYMAENPETVRKFVRATLRGLQDTFANPDEAFAVSLQFIPELAADQQPFQRRVLDETITYWKPADGDATKAGSLNPQAWQTTYTFLRESGILTADIDPTQAYSTEFLP
jgi:NitT/TauT family transport system substrate-binding protein